jgi:hypothetical protein
MSVEIKARPAPTQTSGVGTSVTLWADLSGIVSEPIQSEPTEAESASFEAESNVSSEAGRPMKP